MSNILVEINQGNIGFYLNKNIKKNEEEEIIKLFSRLGKIIKVKNESDLDILTLLFGCSPVIASYFIEVLSRYGKKQGFSDTESLHNALDILKGTIAYLTHKSFIPLVLQKTVATKGGIAEEILLELKRKKIDKQFSDAMDKGFDKIRQLKRELAKE